MLANQKDVLSVELPKKLTPQNVCFFSHITKDMTGSQVDKAKLFLEKNKIIYLGHSTYVCEPIEGYNKRTYTLKYESGEYSCNCQHGARVMPKTGIPCSHLLALRYLWKIQHFNMGHNQDLVPMPLDELPTLRLEDLP